MSDTDQAIVTGPCGDPASQPEVHTRRVETVDGPMVEIALTSAPYCWRVRSWWTPTAAAAIAEQIDAAALVRDHAAATAENERHRNANLVRAVTEGVDPEWVMDLIAAENFDAVPWRITEKFRADHAAAIRELADLRADQIVRRGLHAGAVDACKEFRAENERLWEFVRAYDARIEAIRANSPTFQAAGYRLDAARAALGDIDG